MCQDVQEDAKATIASGGQERQATRRATRREARRGLQRGAQTGPPKRFLRVSSSSGQDLRAKNGMSTTPSGPNPCGKPYSTVRQGSLRARWRRSGAATTKAKDGMSAAAERAPRWEKGGGGSGA